MAFSWLDGGIVARGDQLRDELGRDRGDERRPPYETGRRERVVRHRQPRKVALAVTFLPFFFLCVSTCGSDRQAEARVAAAEGVERPPLFAPVSAEAAQSEEKLALIVAISEQGEPPEGARAYQRLNGPGNDVELLSSALQHHGFPSDNILTVEDAQATKEGILGALESLADRAGPGDIAVFHYSGHGHQITDNNGDEIDGYDEVLVPYGAPDYSAASDEVQAAYRAEHHIRDDTLGVLLDRLAAKVGPEGSVAVFLDACFSGTGTRGVGELSARGGARPIGAPLNDAARDIRALGGGFAEAPGSRGPGTRSVGDVEYIVISAASHRQTAWETYHTDGRTIVGSLSHALAVALPRMRRGESYRDLYGMVVEVMRGKRLPQAPQIEGPADMEVFGSLLTDYEAWVPVGSDEGDGKLVLEGGELRGLGVGSEVEIRGSGGSEDAAAVLATGKIVESSPLSSVLQLESSPPANADLTTGRAFVTRESLGDLTTKIMIDDSVDPATAGLIRDSLAARWVVSVITDAGDGADAILSQESAGRVLLRTTYGGMPVGDAIEVTDRRGAGRLANLVEEFARNAYLRKLSPRDPTIDVTLSLHPATADHSSCNVREADTTSFVHATRLAEGHGDWRISPSPNEVYILKVRNNEATEPYFAILDLMPNGSISQLFPRPRYSVAEARLEAYQEYTLPFCYAVDPVPGLEVIKLFATREPVDFRPLTTSRGQRHRTGGPPNDLERLFSETYQRTRSGEVGAKPALASVSSVQIEVVLDRSQGGA